ALAAVLEEAVHRVRQVLLGGRHAAEPALVILVAGDHARHGRAAFGLAEEGRGAGGHAFDRLGAAFDFFDVDAGMQVLRHGRSPVFGASRAGLFGGVLLGGWLFGRARLGRFGILAVIVRVALPAIRAAID